MRAFIKPADVADLDRRAMQRSNISSFDLMLRVSKEMSQELLKRFPDSSTVFHILSGPGNNGGDGLSVARFLLEAGRSLTVECLLPPTSENAKKAVSYLPKDIFQEPLSKHAVLIDAIFGAQGRADLPKEIQSRLEKLSDWKGICVSLDVPSPGFVADLTLTVAYPKLSFLEREVLSRLGEVVYVGKDFASINKPLMVIEPSDFRLPRRERLSHKGNFGRLAVIGGSPSMPGAAMLAAEAGARIGAGYSSLFFAKKSKSLTLAIRNASFILHSAWTQKDLARETALVIGCGARPPKFFKLNKVKVPMVIDASALSEASSADVKAWKNSKTDILLTPHPGEAAKLLKTKVAVIEKNRLAALDELVLKTGQSVYLKGSPGLLKFRGERSTYVNLSVCSALATAGSGDVLAGIIGGILAQGSLQFEESVLSALAFQQGLARVLAPVEGSISSDQVSCFDRAFKMLRA